MGEELELLPTFVIEANQVGGLPLHSVERGEVSCRSSPPQRAGILPDWTHVSLVDCQGCVLRQVPSGTAEPMECAASLLPDFIQMRAPSQVLRERDPQRVTV